MADRPAQAEVVQAVQCPSCGKLNAPNEDWCWVCYGPLNAKAHAVAMATGKVTPNQIQYVTADQADRTDRRRRAAGTGLSILGGTLAAIGIFLSVTAVAVLVAVYSIFATIVEICSPS